MTHYPIRGTRIVCFIVWLSTKLVTNLAPSRLRKRQCVVLKRSHALHSSLVFLQKCLTHRSIPAPHLATFSSCLRHVRVARVVPSVVFMGVGFAGDVCIHEMVSKFPWKPIHEWHLREDGWKPRWKLVSASLASPRNVPGRPPKASEIPPETAFGAFLFEQGRIDSGSTPPGTSKDPCVLPYENLGSKMTEEQGARESTHRYPPRGSVPGERPSVPET